MFRSLSGRFLSLTIVFIMVAEVVIFVPSVASFRQNYLNGRLERAQIAALSLEAQNDISAQLEAELLANAEVYNVVLRRNQLRMLMLSSPIPEPVMSSYDLRAPSEWRLIMDAFECLFSCKDKVIRVIGEPVKQAGLLIEVTMPTDGLRREMLSYGLRILALSAVLSGIIAIFIFWTVQRMMVHPIRKVVGYMREYAAAPENPHHFITPSSDISELKEAEDALQSLQYQLTAALKHKDRLAQLGAAVAKISHDLRNILTSAQLFTNRIEHSEDPSVARLAPKLVRSITRAVKLCETTLAYGRAEEARPTLTSIALAPMIDDICEAESLNAEKGAITFENNVPADMQIEADEEQMYRVFSNITRNARQAIETSLKGNGIIRFSISETLENWHILIKDTGPGLPPAAQKNLFTAFQGGTRKDSSGLGLAISAELIRGHGGTLELVQTSPEGTAFLITLPKLKP